MKLYALIIFLFIGSAMAAEETPINGTIENSDPVITDFVLGSTATPTDATMNFRAQIIDDNGITTLNTITFTVVQEHENDDAPTEIASYTYTPWSTIAPLSTYSDTTLTFVQPSFPIPFGTYLCSLYVADNQEGSAYTDMQYTITPATVTNPYYVSPITFPPTKVTKTVDSSFTVTNNGSPATITSVTFTSLSVGAQPIPVTSITVDLPTTPIATDQTISIPCHLTVPSGFSAGTLTGTGVVTLEDI